MKTKKTILGTLVLILMFSFILEGCRSSGQTVVLPFAPNVSQFVITVKRGDSGIGRKNIMEIYLDGRKEAVTVKNGGQGQILVRNGIHNIQVRVGKFQSQLLSFEGNSEVVEFYANFEGYKRTTQLNLVKTSGGR